MTTDLNAVLMGKRKAREAELPTAQAPKPTAKPASPAGDRWAMLNDVTDVVLRDLTESETKTWLVLFRDVRNGAARAGMSDIARRCGMSRRSVIRAIDALKARGLLEVTARGTINGKPNTYRLRGPT